MHLINTNTLKLKQFEADCPPYAILSHTWGSDEVSFDDFGDLPKAKKMAGFSKIKLSCEQSLRDGIQYVWVDTCCINRNSSTELSEAINSMYKWYQNAAVCYAYLEDVPEEIPSPELIAPKNIILYGSTWRQIGTKEGMGPVLVNLTQIPIDVLTKTTRLDEVSVADRMSWAAHRKTTREEDVAYSLMGIFDVNMSMLYGEGKKAFIRLQDEILKQTQDDTIFAWQASEQSAPEFPYRGLFAASPKEFSSLFSIRPFSTTMAGTTNILASGHISLSCVMYRENETEGVLGLRCVRDTDLSKIVGINVTNIGNNRFIRSQPSTLAMRSHKINLVFENITMERYAEKRGALVSDDIYLDNAVFIRDIHEGLSFKSVAPNESTYCLATKNFL